MTALSARKPKTMDAFVQYAQDNIVLLVFLIVGLGYIVGKLKIGSIVLGSVTGILVVGLLIGTLQFQVPGILTLVFFTITMFAIGYQSGPSLINSIASKMGLKLASMSLFTTIVAGICLYLVGKGFHLAPWAVGGLTAGSLSNSATLAAAQSAVLSGSFSLPQGLTAKDAANVLGSSYAITYLYGVFGLIILIKICPKLIGMDIAAEAAKLADKGITGHTNLEFIRAWKLSNPQFIGKTVADLEKAAAAHSSKGALPSVEQVLRGGKVETLSPDLVLQTGDVVTMLAAPEELILGTDALGEEVTDGNALSVRFTSAELVITNKALAGRTLADIDKKEAYGVDIGRLVRNGTEMSVDTNVTLDRGDVLYVNGPRNRVDNFAQLAGYIVRNQLDTDLMSMGLFIAFFGAIGTITVTVFGVNLALLGGAPIGAMFGGAVLGWLHSRSPRFGAVAAPAASAFLNLGISVFIAAVALGAGGSFIATLKSSGPTLIIAGVIVTSVSTIACFMYGHFILKLNGAVTAGATSGAMTGSAITEVCNDAKSSVPMTGYAIPVAVSSVLFTLLGVLLMQMM